MNLLLLIAIVTLLAVTTWVLVRFVGGQPAALFILVIGISVMAGSVLTPDARAGEERRWLTIGYNLVAGVPFALIAVTALFVRGYSLAIAQRRRITPLVMMMGGVACLGSLIGLLDRNLVGYVIGDTLKMLIVPTQLFCGTILVRRLSEKEIGKLMMIVTWIAVAGAAASLVQWVFHRAVADQVSGARLWTIGPWTYNLTAFAGLLATWPRGYILRLAWSSALGLVALVGVVTGYRLIFALYAVICVTYGFWIVPRRYWSRFALLGFVGLIALAAGATVLIERGRGTHMLERWKILASDPLNDPSLSGRFGEIGAAVQEMEKSPLSLLVGEGAGATFELYQSAGDYAAALAEASGGELHNIHVFLVGVLFRYGALGVLVWVCVLFTLVRRGLWTISRTTIYRRECWMALSLLLCGVISTTQLSIIDRDYLIWLFVGMFITSGKALPAPQSQRYPASGRFHSSQTVKYTHAR